MTPEREKELRNECKTKGLVNTWIVQELLNELDRVRKTNALIIDQSCPQCGRVS